MRLVALLGRLIWLAIAIPVGTAVVLFAISNRESVTVAMWPFDYAIAVPLYLLPLGGVVIGLLAGAALVSTTAATAKRRAYIAERESERLARQLAEARRREQEAAETARRAAVTGPPAERPAIEEKRAS